MAEVLHQLTITGPQTSRVFVLPLGATTIGRQRDNDLVLVHPLVSRHHATLECTDEACQITDLGSTHGTQVNREQIAPQTPHALTPGDVIEIGAFRLAFEEVDLTAAAVPHQPPAGEETPSAAWEPGRGPSQSVPPQAEANGHFTLPPGLTKSESRYQEYLPDIYYGDGQRFVPRFLALLESILAPIEWNVDNFDLYLDPEAAPAAFLPWLANWYELAFDESWGESSQRRLLKEAHEIYRRRGTVWALSRVLEIYTGQQPEIEDQSKNLDPFTFTVRIPLAEEQVNRTTIERIIDTSKPAHTSYTLIFEA